MTHFSPFILNVGQARISDKKLCTVLISILVLLRNNQNYLKSKVSEKSRRTNLTIFASVLDEVSR